MAEIKTGIILRFTVVGREEAKREAKEVARAFHRTEVMMQRGFDIYEEFYEPLGGILETLTLINLSRYMAMDLRELAEGKFGLDNLMNLSISFLFLVTRLKTIVITTRALSSILNDALIFAILPARVGK